MELDEVIRFRRSIRSYKSTPLSREQILAILDAGNRAPSAKNRQQWRFHVLQGNTKDELVQLCIEAYEQIPEKSPGSSAMNSFRIMNEAPVVVLVFCESEWGAISPAIQSVAAAIQNMLLKAYDSGLGSLWICDVLFIEEAIRTQLDIPIPLIAAVAFGYPDESPIREPRLRVEDVTKWH